MIRESRYDIVPEVRSLLGTTDTISHLLLAVNTPTPSISLAWAGCDGSSSNKADAQKHAEDASSDHSSFLALDGSINADESTNNSPSAGLDPAVPESSPTAGVSPLGTPPPPRGEDSPSIDTAESKMDVIYERQSRVKQVAKAQVQGGWHGPSDMRCTILSS